MLTHGNFMFELGVAIEELDELFDAEDAARPCCSCRWRTCSPAIIQVGARQGAGAARPLRRHQAPARRPRGVPADVHAGRAPRVREGLQHRQPGGRRRRPRAGSSTAPPRPRSPTAGRWRAAARARCCAPRHALFDRLVYARLRAALGGRCAYAVSGGAPLGERLGHFYRGIGVTVLEGYGLTETTAALTVNLPDALKIGTVGPAARRHQRSGSPTTASCSFRGGQVFAATGTTTRPPPRRWTRTAGSRTGDLGEIDDEGFVRITGRKKEILVTAGGKNVAPAVLEDRIRAHPLVEPVHGGRRRPAVHRGAGHHRPRGAGGLGRAARQVRRRRATSSTTRTCAPRSRPRSTRPTRRSPRPSRSAVRDPAAATGPRRAGS